MSLSGSRILLISERYPPDIGGVARSAGRIAENLSGLGLELEVVTWSRYLQPGEVQRQTLPTAGATLTVHCIGQYRHWDMTLPHTLNLLDWLYDANRIDAVWGHYAFPPGFVAVWWAERRGLPSLVSVRGNDVDRAMFPPGDFARLHWTLGRATLVAAVSQDMAQKVTCLNPESSVQVLHNGVDTDCFVPPSAGETGKAAAIALRQSLGIADDEIVLGFSGELREKKGQRFLLQALTRVRQVRPACLLIIGEARPSTQPLLQGYRAEFPEDSDRLIITGHLPDPQAVACHLHLCDLYLQPSLWEGLPNGLLEAMACDRCCLASDVGGIPEVIDHGKTGFIVPCAQLHHLGDMVLECLEQADLADIGHNAGAHIRQQFSQQQERLQLTKLLHCLGL